jgi:hypothetical protein
MFYRVTDDHVVVASIFFAAFSVCVAGVAIVAGIHRVGMVVDAAVRTSH